MKRVTILLLILLLLTAAAGVSALTDEVTVLTETEEDLTGAVLEWNEDGTGLTLVTAQAVECIDILEPDFRQTITAANKDFSFSSASRNRIIAAFSAGRQTAALFRAESPQDVIKIEPDFPVLSMALSRDGQQLVVNAADEIRTLIYSTENGRLTHDLSGFQTAAPVYDSRLSDDGNFVFWHARGTFALQSVEDGSFGRTISLWDFASASALSPDSASLAVSIVNEDYENGTIIFFDPQTGEELGRADLGKFAPYSISFSADGETLLAADSDTLYRIDAGTFELLSQLTVTDPEDDEDRILTAVLSPDGSRTAVLTAAGRIILAENR